MFQPLSDKPSLKGACSVSRDQVQNFTLHEISSERLKLALSNFVCFASASLRNSDEQPSLKGAWLE